MDDWKGLSVMIWEIVAIIKDDLFHTGTDTLYTAPDTDTWIPPVSPDIDVGVWWLLRMIDWWWVWWNDED